MDIDAHLRRGHLADAQRAATENSLAGLGWPRYLRAIEEVDLALAAGALSANIETVIPK